MDLARVSVKLVRMVVGRTQLTLIPSGISSFAMHLGIMVTAALVQE